MLALLVFFAVAWPWFVGAWVAERFLHAEDPSLTRSVVAWGFEGLYLVGMAYLVFALYRRRTRRQAEATARLWEWVDRSRHRAPFPSSQRASIDDYDPVELIALAIWVQSTHPKLGKNQQLREMRKYLGFSRMGSKIRPALERAWDDGHGYLTGWVVPESTAPDAPSAECDVESSNADMTSGGTPTSGWDQAGETTPEATPMPAAARLPPPTGPRYDLSPPSSV